VLPRRKKERGEHPPRSEELCGGKKVTIQERKRGNDAKVGTDTIKCGKGSSNTKVLVERNTVTCPTYVRLCASKTPDASRGEVEKTLQQNSKNKLARPI